MQKWEYCEIELSPIGPLARANATLITYQSDGNHKEYTNQYGVLIAFLGQQGWELTASAWHTAVGLTAPQRITHIFKRPIQG
jgi:hypothetical protein